MSRLFAIPFVLLAACADEGDLEARDAKRAEDLRAAYGAGAACIRAGQSYTDCDRLCWNLDGPQFTFQECSRGAVAAIAMKAGRQ